MSSWWSEDQFESRRKMLSIGRDAELLLADLLRERGFKVEVCEQELDEQKSGFTLHPEDFDLRVNDKYYIEVKSRNFAFGEKNYGYPMDTVWIDDPAGWDRKHHKPDFVVQYSRPTGKFIGLDVEKTRDFWFTEECWDGLRGFSHPNYSCHPKYLIHMSEVLERMRDGK